MRDFIETLSQASQGMFSSQMGLRLTPSHQEVWPDFWSSVLSTVVCFLWIHS